MATAASLLPDVNGRFGPYGGRYVPETLMFALRQLTEQYDRAREDPEFQKQIDYYFKHYVGRLHRSTLPSASRAKRAGAHLSIQARGLTIPARTRSTLHRPRPC